MDNIINLVTEDVTESAIKKINKENESFRGDRYGNAVHTYVANTLRDFCKQNETFAKVVLNTKRTLSDCCAEIMKGCGTSISDIEVYRRATKFYFPNAEVNFIMQVTLTGEEPDEEYLSKEAEKPKKSEPKKTESKPAPKKEAAPKTETKPKKEPAKKKEKPKPEVLQFSLF